uniref:Uncharacterized protein n=1 Tax=Leersia perrieri TaxID=77586 RepID=A0A0D9XVT0_9ORYZ
MEEVGDVCALHPGVAVTGFCPSCLRDRLAGLQPPPSSADLRRCKSFSYYARSSSSSFMQQQQQEEPHRRSSCEHPIPMKEHITRHHYQQHTSKQGPFGAIGKRWQEWRRKSKLKTKQQEEESAMPPELGRRSCDVFSDRSRSRINMNMNIDPRACCDGAHHPQMMIPRSDDQIPVEEEDEQESVVGMPGGSAQTRDYYLHSSSSSSRRRRSVDRKSIDGADLLPRMAANARVSPALRDFYPQQHHYQHHPSSFEQPPLPIPLDATTMTGKSNSKPTKNKGIKGWSIWGLLHKKTNHNVQFGGGEARPPPPPELRARGYDGQMLRCNSSVSARSSFSGAAGLGLRRADEVLLERNFSARYSTSSSSCRMTAHSHPHYFHHHNSIANNPGAARPPPPPCSSLPRSSLGLYNS